MITPRRLALAAVLALAPLAVAAQDSARDRWNALSPEERSLLFRRFNEFRRLSEDERTALRERAGELEDLKRAVAASLPPMIKKGLAELDPEERRAVLRDHVLLRARELAERVREALPPEDARALDERGPRDHPGWLASLKRRVRDEGGVAALAHRGAALGLPQGEIARLQGLPLSERLDAVLSLERALLRRAVEENGLPRDLAPEAWKELETLSDREFFERWRDLRREGLGSRHGPAASPRHGGTDAWAELDQLARPRFEDLERVSGLPRFERKRKVAELVRERCLEYLERHELLGPAELAELGRKRGPEFAEALRAAIREHWRPAAGNTPPARPRASRPEPGPR